MIYVKKLKDGFCASGCCVESIRMKPGFAGLLCSTLFYFSELKETALPLPERKFFRLKYFIFNWLQS
jgi:hypothetical protein